MGMSPWFITVLVALALLMGLYALRRRNRPADQIAPDSTTQVAALRALGESAAAPPPGTTHEAATQRTLREIAVGVAMPAAAPQRVLTDEIYTLIGAALKNIVDKPNYAPRRPMQLPKLMQAINNDTASRSEFSQIIAGD